MVDDVKFNLPRPDEIQRRSLDNRSVNYITAPVGQQITLRGDSSVNLNDSTVNIMPGIQQFLGNSGSYFNKSQDEPINAAVDINTFSCGCGKSNGFKVIKSNSVYKSKEVLCAYCGEIYGFIPENIYNIISSPGVEYMTREEISNVISRQPKTNKYIVFQKGR